MHQDKIMIYNIKKGGHIGPEGTTNIEQEFGLHIEMGTVYGWCADGMGR